MAEQKAEYDPFIIETTFPDPVAILKTFHPSITDIADNCVYALDANVMLATFGLNKAGLKDVEKHFRQLVKADRLFLPAQAVREFARHRSTYVAQAFEELSKLTTTYPTMPKELDAPLFEMLPEYKKVSESIETVRKAIAQYKEKGEALIGAARYINNNDAASKLFSELFSPKQIIEHGMTKEDLKRDLAHRSLHDIPPGFKDKGKPDGGIGDVSIWHSLIKLAKDKKRGVIFVSNDAKPDWVVGVDKEKPFGPRPELVEEFMRTTGQQFGIVQIKTFLSLIGSKAETVATVPTSSLLNRESSFGPSATAHMRRLLTILLQDLKLLRSHLIILTGTPERLNYRDLELLCIDAKHKIVSFLTASRFEFALQHLGEFQGAIDGLRERTEFLDMAGHIEVERQSIVDGVLCARNAMDLLISELEHRLGKHLL